VLRWCMAPVCCLLLVISANSGQAQRSIDQAATLEREVDLFILNPPPASDGALVLLWIPPPVQRFCVGRTQEQCVAIDYCIRTINRNVPQCRALPVDVANVPKYPESIYPRRVLAVTYFRGAATAIKGVADLLEYFDDQQRSDYDRLSTTGRIRAKIG
jgi:hypothetical protein